jgi:hypothetical protein
MATHSRYLPQLSMPMADELVGWRMCEALSYLGLTGQIECHVTSFAVASPI